MSLNDGSMWRRWRWTLLVLGLAGCVAVVLSGGIIPWTPFNCLYQDVDIRTGRVREIRYLCYCRVSDRIRDSAISLALDRQMVRIQTADWRRVNTLSPPMTMHSPHHGFHGAIAQIKQIEEAWQLAYFSPAAKREIALTLLSLWQTSGNYYGARDYVLSIWQLEVQRHGAGKQSIAPQDLPLRGATQNGLSTAPAGG